MPLHFEGDRAQLKRLVDLCRSELRAEQVWLVDLRARRDQHPDSGWVIMAILADDALEEMIDQMAVWRIKQLSGLNVDIFVMRPSEFIGDLGGPVAFPLRAQILDDREAFTAGCLSDEDLRKLENIIEASRARGVRETTCKIIET